jgi:hypothetical protein
VPPPVVDDTGGVVAVVVCWVVSAPVPAVVEPPAADEEVAEEEPVVLVVDVVSAELGAVLVAGTVATPVVGTVSTGAPVVLLTLALLPLPQAARVTPAANAAIRASIRERVGIARYLRH